MLRLTADENFNNDIVRGLRRRKPEIEIVRIQDVGLSGVDDPSLLEWCARRRANLAHARRLHDDPTMLMSEFGQVYPCPVFLKSAAESRWVTPSQTSSFWSSAASKRNGKVRCAASPCVEDREPLNRPAATARLHLPAFSWRQSSNRAEPSSKIGKLIIVTNDAHCVTLSVWAQQKNLSRNTACVAPE